MEKPNPDNDEFTEFYKKIGLNYDELVDEDSENGTDVERTTTEKTDTEVVESISEVEDTNHIKQLKQPRWEVKYNEYKRNSQKYVQYEKLLKALEGSEAKSFGEYMVNFYKKELEGYNNFKKNETKIENILEYRKELETRLEEKNGYKSEVVSKRAEKTRIELELLAQKRKMDNLINSISYEKLSETERGSNEKDFDLVKTEEEIKKLEIEHDSLTNKISELESKCSETRFEDYSRKIDKCNKIAENLLTGKSLAEIELPIKVADNLGQNNEPASNMEYGNKLDGYGNRLDGYNNKKINKGNLAKITLPTKIKAFFNGLKNKVANLFKKNNNETQKVDNQEIEDNKMEREDKLLLQIADEGREQTFKVRVRVSSRPKTPQNKAPVRVTPRPKTPQNKVPVKVKPRKISEKNNDERNEPER